MHEIIQNKIAIVIPLSLLQALPTSVNTTETPRPQSPEYDILTQTVSRLREETFSVEKEINEIDTQTEDLNKKIREYEREKDKAKTKLKELEEVRKKLKQKLMSVTNNYEKAQRDKGIEVKSYIDMVYHILLYDVRSVY